MLRLLRTGVLALFPAWFVIGCMLWWAETPGVEITLWDAFAAGAPWWIAALPVLGLASLVVLVRRPAASYWYLLVLGIAAVVVAFLTLSAWTPAGMGSWLSWGPGLSLILGPAFTAVALILARRNPPPLESPFAHVLYLGRYQFLCNLLGLAGARQWLAAGPIAPEETVAVGGFWNGRPVYIESGLISAAEWRSPASHYVQVSVGTRLRLWPMLVHTAMPQISRARAYVQSPEKHEARWLPDGSPHDLAILGGEAVVARLWSPPGERLAPTALGSLRMVIESGRRFMKHDRPGFEGYRLFTHGDGVRYEHRSAWRLAETAEDVEQIIAWLARIVQAMEATGLCGEVAPGTRQGSSFMALPAEWR